MRLRKMDLKTKAWAQEYIKNGFNGTETAITFGKNGLKRKTAQAIASENLSKPIYQRAILEELENVKMSEKERARLMKRNAKQQKSFSASNQAIDMLNKIAGDYAPELKQSLNITLTGKDLDNKIKEKIEELKALQNEV